MYVGRIVSVGKSSNGANAALYRVSSRSFPNRTAVNNSGRLAIVPREGHEDDVQKNPYIAYNCLRIAGDWAVVTNGSHTDPIAEKIELGMPVRDALASTMLAMDYEKDAYNTPRISGVVPVDGDTGWLAIVRDDALVVKAIALEPGRAWYVATYEHDDVSPTQRVDFDASDADAAARFIVDGGAFADLEKPVTSAAAIASRDGFQLGTHTV
ncbi:MAG: IMP cyclohydrolase [bacterium]|nr:IMP cyclohydrolase [bacterium]